jgi:glycosyltransferase involved in cell wall biosynthesis
MKKIFNSNTIEIKFNKLICTNIALHLKNMSIILSIIIPCFNSAETLEEAVESCFKQNLNDFEIILVDDGSTDKTREIIVNYSKIYTNVKYVFHNKNKGGGAARNTGIEKAKGKIIFCLDSDNLLFSNSLSPMITYLQEKSTNGVAFHERRFFPNSDKGNFTSHFNKILDRPIFLEDIFNDSETLLDNFLFTKESYLKAGKYPEHHDFDTQAFEMRFLGVGNEVLIMKDSVFFHRQATKVPSYFEREYNSGNFSINYYLCLEDIFHLLSNISKETIIKYNIFENGSLLKNLMYEMKNLQRHNQLFKNTTESQKTEINLYEQHLYYFKNEEYKKALESLIEIRNHLYDTQVVYYSSIRCKIGSSGVEKRQIERKTLEEIRHLIKRPKKLYKSYHRNFILNRILRTFKKWLLIKK